MFDRFKTILQFNPDFKVPDMQHVLREFVHTCFCSEEYYEVTRKGLFLWVSLHIQGIPLTVMLTKAGNVGKVQKVYYNPHSPPILSLGQMLGNNEHLAFLATQNAGYFVKKKFVKEKLKEHRGKKVYQKVARRIPHELWTPIPSIFGLSKVLDGKSAVGSKDMVLENQAYQWHLRLGHVSTDTLKAMQKLKRIDFTDKEVKDMESFPCNYADSHDPTYNFQPSTTADTG